MHFLKCFYRFVRTKQVELQRTYLRKKWTKRVKKQVGSYGERLIVNYPTYLSKNTHLGNYDNFNGMKIIGEGKVTIGDYFHSGPECVILNSNHNYEGEMIPYDSTNIVKDVEIGDFVWLGQRVFILGGVKIGEGAIIQACSVVVSDIPDYAIAGGSPAKVFKYRDIEHFKKLKEEGKFN